VVKTYVKDGLSKSDVGLGNVDNTSDATKNSATVTLTNKTLTSPVINGGTINNAAIGGTTPAAGNFTSLGATGNTTLGDASGDTLTINGTAVSAPNGLNVNSNQIVLSSGNLGLGVTPSGWGSFRAIDVSGYLSLAGYTPSGYGGGIYANTYYDGSNYRYKSSNAANYMQIGALGVSFFNAPSGTAGNAISFGGPKMTLTAAGDLLTGGKTSTTANGGDVQVSRGVTFPATQVACSDANTLDDYEEGTWTAVVTGSSTPGTYNYNNNIGTYTKIGRVVQVNVDIHMSGYSVAGSGTLVIAGLPFAAANQNQGGNIIYHYGISLTKDYTLAGITGNTTTVRLLDLGQDGTQSIVQVSAVPNADSYIRFNLTYIV